MNPDFAGVRTARESGRRDCRVTEVRDAREERGENKLLPWYKVGYRVHNPIHGRSTQRVSPSYRSSRRGTSRILAEQFDLEGATALGGLNRLHRFLQHSGLEREVRRRFRGAKAAWAEWRLDQVLRVFLDIAFAGLP